MIECWGGLHILKDRKEDWIIVGTVLKPHGVSGFVKILPHTDAPDRFRKGVALFLRRRGDDERELRIEELRNAGGSLIVRFEGVATRSDAEDLRGADLVIPIEEAARLPKGNFYIFEIIGMSVFNERGESRGVVRNVYSQPQYDMYEIEYDGREYLIPAVREFISEIDTGKRAIHIVEHEGLIE